MATKNETGVSVLAYRLENGRKRQRWTSMTTSEKEPLAAVEGETDLVEEVFVDSAQLLSRVLPRDIDELQSGKTSEATRTPQNARRVQLKTGPLRPLPPVGSTPAAVRVHRGEQSCQEFMTTSSLAEASLAIPSELVLDRSGHSRGRLRGCERRVRRPVTVAGWIETASLIMGTSPALVLHGALETGLVATHEGGVVLRGTAFASRAAAAAVRGACA